MSGLDKWILVACAVYIVRFIWRDHIAVRQYRASERARRDLGRNQ